MKKIALLLPETIDRQTLNLIAELQQLQDAEILFIEPQFHAPSPTLHEISYKALMRLEQKIISHISDEVKTHLAPQSDNALPEYPRITCEPEPSDDCLCPVLKEQNIDLIIDCDTSRKFDRTKLAACAKAGMTGIFYNQKIAFWEVYNRRDRIAFTIEQISHESSRVLFSGEIATFRFVTETAARLLRESFPYLIQQIDTFVHTGDFFVHPNAKSYPFQNKTPNLFQHLGYLTKTAVLFAELAVRRKILKQYTRFSVAFSFGSTEELKEHPAKILSKGHAIQPPPNHFYADPFVWTKEGRHICFLEDYDYTQNIAWISAVEIFEDGSYEILGEVIKEPFHLSFPYLFEYGGELYMVPESSAANSIRLYKCINFPLEWEFQKELLSNIKTADTMLFSHEGKWWMLTNQSTKNNADQAAQLFVYYNDSPLKSEGWKPHPLNPVLFSSDGGRNAGIVLSDSGLPIRAGQRQRFNIYGAAFCLNQITELTETTYKERRIANIEPDFWSNLRATHHLHTHNGIVVYDFMRYRKLD